MPPVALYLNRRLRSEGIHDSGAAKKAISDGYSGLKALISKKFVGQSDVTDAIEKIQAHSHFDRLDIILNSSRVRT
jgi:hypothetical protein